MTILISSSRLVKLLTTFSSISLQSWIGLSKYPMIDCTAELLELSYRTILLTLRRILLASCPQEAEYANSRVAPCNSVPSGWTLCKYSGILCGLVHFWKLWHGFPLCHDVCCQYIATIISLVSSLVPRPCP